MNNKTLFTNEEIIELKGNIKKYIFKAKENNFCICAFFLDDKNDEIIIKGHLEHDLENIPLVLKGKYHIHKQYGRQFVVNNYKKNETNFTRTGLIEYLKGDKFPGIGEKKAKAIVDKLGTNAITIIKNDKKSLNNIKGLTPILQERIYQILQEEDKNYNILISLLSLDITHAAAYKIIKVLGENSYEIIKENPYILAYKVPGFGFLKSDIIAKKLGITENDPRRIRAGILYALSQLEDNTGNSYTKKDTLISYLKRELKITEDIENVLKNLANNQNIIIINEKIYLMTTYQTEIEIADNLKRLSSGDYFLNDKEKEIKKLFNNYEKFSKITYTTQQKEAIFCSLTNKISIITGGPGTGKTTIIKAIIELYATINDYNKAQAIDKIALIAPTGRAAKRMSEVLDHPASTIHKFLEFDIEKFGFRKNKTNPVKSEIIVVDESSMVDTFLANSLLNSIPTTSSIIFVGDADQLPSIGVGNFFKDIIESGKIPTTFLNEIYRQAEGSSIIKLSRLINNETLKESDLKNLSGDIKIKYLNDDYITENIIKIINTSLKNNYDIINDIQVLVPLRNGPVGVNKINREIQKEYISKKGDIEKTPNIKIKSPSGDFKIFYEGDKIIQNENDKKTGIMNGNIGEIKKIREEYIIGSNKKQIVIDILFDDELITYYHEDLSKIDLAYAITIHKSQGCEFPIIIVPISMKYSIMLKKELLYTAITRTRDDLYLIGNLNIMPYYIKEKGSQRLTTLKERINDAFSKNDNKPKIKLFDPSDFM